MCPELEDDEDDEFLVIESGPGSHVKVGGKDYLNMCSFNFLSLADSPEALEKASQAIEKYGVLTATE